MELIHMTEGSVNFFVNGETFSLQEGDTLFIPPYALHRVSVLPDTATCYQCVCFDLTFCMTKRSGQAWKKGLLRLRLYANQIVFIRDALRNILQQLFVPAEIIMQAGSLLWLGICHCFFLNLQTEAALYLPRFWIPTKIFVCRLWNISPKIIRKLLHPARLQTAFT